MNKAQSHEKKIIICHVCNITKATVDFNVKKYVCATCCNNTDQTIKQYFDKLSAPKVANIPQTKKPRGWKFMKQFVDSQGNVYERGVLMPQLFGTKQITPIKKSQKKVKVSKRQQYNTEQQIYAKVNKLKAKIIKAYQQKDTKLAHRLEKESIEYKKQVKKFLKQ